MFGGKKYQCNTMWILLKRDNQGSGQPWSPPGNLQVQHSSVHLGIILGQKFWMVRTCSSVACALCNQKVVALKLPWYFVQASSLTQIVYPSCTTLHLMMTQQAGLVQPPFLPRRHLLHPNPISSMPTHTQQSLSPPSLHHTQQRSPPWTLGSLDISTMGN